MVTAPPLILGRDLKSSDQNFFFFGGGEGLSKKLNWGGGPKILRGGL